MPISIPGLLLEGRLQMVGMRPPSHGALRLTPRVGKAGEGPERHMQKPAEPHALALPAFADAVHAVVPVARAHQRQPMSAEAETGVEAASAMLEECRGLIGDGGLEECIMLARR